MKIPNYGEPMEPVSAEQRVIEHIGMMDQVKHMCVYMDYEYTQIPISGSSVWMLRYTMDTDKWVVFDVRYPNNVQRPADFSTKEHWGALRTIYRNLLEDCESKAHRIFINSELSKHGIHPDMIDTYRLKRSR